MDFGISVGRKVKTTVAGRAMGDDALGIDDRHLRTAPGRARRHAGLHAIKRSQITLVPGRLDNTHPKLGLVGHAAIVPDEIGARQLSEWPTNERRAREKSRAAVRCDHGEDQVTDAGDG